MAAICHTFTQPISQESSCTLSLYQSPISLSSRSPAQYESTAMAKVPRDKLKYRYNPDNHEFIVKNKIPISFVYNNALYLLEEFHFHQPGEHKLNGHRYPLEFHIVFSLKTAPIIVLGLMVKLSDRTSTILSRIIAGKKIRIPHFTDYWSYSGSLTTGSFTGDINWLINQRILEVTPSDLAILKKLSKSARPLQPRYGRNVVLAHCKNA